jgi:hypothetical protein
MKKLQLITILLFASIFIANAQSNFIVNEVRQIMSKGEQTGFEVPIAGGKAENVKSNFEKWLKKNNAKVTSSKKSPEIFGDNASLKLVSQNTVDIYATCIPSGNGAVLYVYADLGGAFISSAAYPQQYTAMEAMLKKFSQEQALEMVESQLEQEEKILKTLNKDIENLKKDKTGYVKDIETAKALIIQREQDIIKNDNDQKSKLEQQNLQQQIIETVKQKRATLK